MFERFFPVVLFGVALLVVGIFVYDARFRPHPMERCKALCAEHGGKWWWSQQDGCSCGTFVVPAERR